MSDIYNKNAREAHLMAEAYTNIYKEGQFYGRDDLVKKNREEDKARGAVKLELRDSAGTRRATLPKGDPKIDELLAKGYTKVEDNESRAERADVDRYEYEQGKEAGEGQSLAKYVAEIAQDIITDNPDEPVPPEAAFDFAVEMLQAFLGELTFNDVKDRIHSSEDAEMQFDSRGFAINTPAGGEVEESVEVGNIYKGESYDEIVVDIQGDEVFTRELAEGGNRYDINQMLNELTFVNKINI